MFCFDLPLTSLSLAEPNQIGVQLNIPYLTNPFPILHYMPTKNWEGEKDNERNGEKASQNKAIDLLQYFRVKKGAIKNETESLFTDQSEGQELDELDLISATETARSSSQVSETSTKSNSQLD